MNGWRWGRRRSIGGGGLDRDGGGFVVVGMVVVVECGIGSRGVVAARFRCVRKEGLGVSLKF